MTPTIRPMHRAGLKIDLGFGAARRGVSAPVGRRSRADASRGRAGLLAVALLAVASAGAPARAADAPFFPAVPAFPGEPGPVGPGYGGFRVARAPVRPAPLRYDIYGYPLLPAPPSPLADGGCPPALQPDYDADGNLAGYAPIPMCR